jgi:hypothetical protein
MMSVFVWTDTRDKQEQPWEAPSRDEAFSAVRELQQDGCPYAGFWDTDEGPWPFGEKDG